MNSKIRVLLYGSNLWYLGEGMLGPLFAVFAQRVGGSVLDISWAWAIYLITAGILQAVVGRLSDHISKEALMVGGYALNSLFTFAYLLVQEPVHLFAVQVGLGVAAACANPSWSALYAKYETKNRAGTEWGLAGGEAQIVTGIAVIIGGLVVSYASFTALFLLMGVIQTVATFYQMKILEVKR